MPKRRQTEMQDAGDNIFADLDRPDAQEHYVKAQLVFQIAQIMKRRQLTQTAASKLMGITQPDVSNMLRGRFRGKFRPRCARSDGENRRPRAASSPVRARVAGSLVSLAHPLPVRGAFASGDSTKNRSVAPGADVSRSIR
jgi:predicted XRE-type DNA-binding protein